MTASVIIATYRRPDMIGRCLDALARQTVPPLEVLVVDQSPDTATEELVRRLAQKSEGVRYFHTTRAGVSHARNIGLRAARGDVLAITDDDAIPDAGWLSALLRAFHETRDRVGLVGGRVLAVWDQPKPSWFPPSREFLLPVFDRPGPLATFPSDALPISVNLALHRSVLERIGLFNENIGRRPGWKATGEDSLFALTAMDAGIPIYYQPDAIVWHPVEKARTGRSALLERHLYEGVCQVDIEDKRGTLDASRATYLLGRNVMRALWWTAKIMTYPSSAPWNDPRVIEALSHAATSLGVVRACASKLTMQSRRVPCRD